ncbi:MAG: AAA family ATPase [Archaeoglobaceae archaeon]
MLKLREVHIKNFKSLRDCKLELRNFNVLVGANASGKTNLVDLFLLLRKIYVEREINPFRYWWGYQNAVWNRREELDITVRFLFEYIYGEGEYNVSFETTFTGRGGRFDILREKLEVEGIFSLELEGNVLTITHSEDFLLSQIENLERYAKKEYLPPPLRHKFGGLSKGKIVEALKEQTVFTEFINSVLYITKEGRAYYPLFRQGIVILPVETPERRFEYLIIISPPVKEKVSANIRKRAFVPVPLFTALLEDLSELLSRLLVLKLNIDEIKRPSPLKKEEWLSVDGSNLNSVLYNIYLKKNRVPERIATILSYLFPNINVEPSITEDQRVYIKIYEDDLELPPVCIADGLYKLLAILSALELEPSLLIIDEIENSLHPKTLEKLLDELKSSDTTVIVTTHSPVVVDMTEPEDLVIVEKFAGETKFRRIKNPEEIKKKLREAGITFSEGWLYGEI